MKLKIYFLIVFSLIFFNSSMACIDQMDSSVPACPNGKTQILDDTFPAAAVTIAPGNPEDGMSLDFVSKVFSKQGDTKIILSGWNNEKYLNLIEKLKKLGGSDEQIKNRLIFLPKGPEYRYQQDYLKTEVDPISGAPIIRPIDDYLHYRDGVKQQDYLKETTQAYSSFQLFCSSQVKVGSSIPTTENKAESNYGGGNIQGFPHGLCLVGDSLPANTLSSVCKGGASAAVVVPVKWLAVGHVDEVVSVVKDNTASPPCNYAVLRASPKLALDLLIQANKNETTANLPYANVPSTYSNTPNEDLCNAYNEYLETTEGGTNAVPPASIPSTAPKATSIFWLKQFISLSFAQQVSNVHKLDCKKEVNLLTNKQAYLALMNSPKLKDYNEIVESKMQEAEQSIKKAAAQNACPNIKVIPVPNLFSGFPHAGDPPSREPVSLILTDGRSINKPIADLDEFTEFPFLKPSDRMRYFNQIDHRDGTSLNPNPANCVSLGNDVYFPDQKNPIFSNYLKTQASNLKLEANFIDTWESAHVGGGNIHCATQTMRYCRPQKK